MGSWKWGSKVRQVMRGAAIQMAMVGRLAVFFGWLAWAVGMSNPGLMAEEAKPAADGKEKDGAVQLPPVSDLAEKVIAVADEPTSENLERFHRALLQGKVGVEVGELPKGATPGLPRSSDGKQVRLPFVNGPSSEKMLYVLCDVPRLAKLTPNANYAEIDIRTVLEIAKANRIGIIVQVLHTEKKHWAGIRREEVEMLLARLDKEAKAREPKSLPQSALDGDANARTEPASAADTKKGYVKVPPGHKVVVVRPSPGARFEHLESGTWIADLGSERKYADVVASVEKMAAEKKPGLVVWIVQPTVLEAEPEFGLLLEQFGEIARKSKWVLGNVAVAPFATDKHFPAMRRLRDAGFGVHFAADDGACFVEVHKPDGIVVGMAGKAFKD